MRDLKQSLVDSVLPETHALGYNNNNNIIIFTQGDLHVISTKVLLSKRALYYSNIIYNNKYPTCMYFYVKVTFLHLYLLSKKMDHNEMENAFS